MGLAAFALKHRTTMWVLVICLVFGGIQAYNTLGRLEDPEFTIKEAKVVTPYRGATPAEVAEEVSEVMEKAVQQLGQIKEVRSTSQPGLSILTVEIQDKYDGTMLPQVWDELRRKVGDAQSKLPPGAGPSVVNDDFGDVFGVLLAVYGDGFSYKELYEHAKSLERELLLVQDVGKVVLYGVQSEAIYIEISRERMAQLGVSENSIYKELQGKNVVRAAGDARVGREYIKIVPEEGLDSVDSIGNLLVRGLGSESQVYLKDIATITRGYQDPPTTALHFDGHPAIGLAVSTAPGGNVVTMGDGVAKRLEELEAVTPWGIETGTIYYQSVGVVKSVKSFVVSLIQAILIVIGVLVFAMGLRSGILIGTILLLTVFATFIVMKAQGISLERISLGALIIALGMLVDNAIVVTEGIMVRVAAGQERFAAAKEVVAQTLWPLLGATFVAILAFAALGASQDSTGEFCRSLYQVIMSSLLLSWLLAVTVTALFCVTFLKDPDPDVEAVDPYGGIVFRGYRAFLAGCIKMRWVTVAFTILLFAVSVRAFNFVDQSFFPNSTTPQFTVDYWVTEGTDIRETTEDLESIGGMEGVEHVATCIGQGAPRFLLTYSPEQPNTAYGQFIVEVSSFEYIAKLIQQIEAHIGAHHPDALAFGKPFVLGPGGGSDIEVRLRGPDRDILRRLSSEVERVMLADPVSRDVRNDWRQRTKTLVPVMNDTMAARMGLTRRDVADALQRTYGGLQVGLYREGEDLIPIVARAPARESTDIGDLMDMQIWSMAAGGTVPLQQVVARLDARWDDHIIERRDRVPTITPQCNANDGPASRLLARLMPKINARFQELQTELDLGADYGLEWGGEYENSGDAQAGIAAKLPFTLLIMVLIVLSLFNALRQPLLIFLTVPLGLIGVSWGLLLAGEPFGFMALLGLLSLIGMMIKNAVVLVDETDLQIREGKPRMSGVLDAAVSRLRPVAMAAFTTVLGMIPLLPDVFFSSLAVTIMGGLGFATVLTLVFVPVLYAIFFGIREDEVGESPEEILEDLSS
ncbi:MAG: efflux RND transporter permease subunit [Planctomycetota bacterium]|nr:efflux RND transporter permease subunit [Planctomycetota bacterium]